MSAPIVMPSFGMYTAEGTLINWLAADGATVEVGQPVAEIETDKAVNEIVAPAAGRLQHKAAIGSLVKEEGVIGYVEALSEAASKAVGETLSKGVGEAVGEMAVEATVTRAEPAALNGAVETGFIKASPHARHLARQHDLDLARVKPSGPNGRIVAEDVKVAIALLGTRPGTRAPDHADACAEPQPVVARPPVDRMPGAQARPSFPVRPGAPASRQPLAPIRRTIGERLAHSQSTAVALTLTREVDAETFVKARRGLGEKLGGAVPFDALFIKVLAAALRECPELNATVDGPDLLTFSEVNVGFAVSTSGGLVVPVVGQAQDKRLRSIVDEMRGLIAKASSNSLRAEDISGGTTTISNLGAYGVDAFTPVINPPQASILGIGRIKRRLQVRDDGSFNAANTCWLSLTFDHRVTDGVPAARLLDAVSSRMNDYDYLLAL